MLDVVTITEPRTLGYGIAGSLALHLFLFSVLAVWMSFEPVRRLMDSASEPAVTMIFADDILPPEPEPAPPPRTESQRYIRTTQNEESQTPPSKADFISDRNTVAAAKLPDAGGRSALPTTKGVDVATMEIANRDYRDGSLKNDSAVNTPPGPQLPVVRPPAPKPAPAAAAEEQQPPDISRSGVAGADSPAMKSPDDEAPVLRAIPIAPPPAPPAINAPRPEPGAFQPQTRTAEAKGTISNLGPEDSVNAMATPEGRYTRQVQAAIAKRWHANMRARADLVNPGRLRVYFSITKEGKPEKIEFLCDKRDFMLQDVTLTSILEAELPPVPEEVLARTVGERFPMQFNVVYY